jgi:hypothetical protein
MLLKIGLDSILVYCRIQHDKVIISIYIVFYRAALKAPHSSADPPPPLVEWFQTRRPGC